MINIKKVCNILFVPNHFKLYLASKNIIKMDDLQFVSIAYKKKFHREINLTNPKTYNEKLQWLKLYDRNPLYTKLVDKYEVKKYVSDILGDEYVIPTLGVYNSFDEINFDELPNQFVMKCTHDCGGLIIVKDKSKLNVKKAKRKINKCLKRNYYYSNREWPYKDVKPRIIVEKYMEDVQDNELRDYKLFCFNGKYKMMFIATNRQGKGETCFDFFDRDFNHLPFTNGHPNALQLPHKPKNYELMIELAEKILNDIPQVRVDFYEVNGRVYFGEITFFHWSGLVPFDPEEWDEKIGSWIELPKK